jgi:hypothetical protein
MGVHCNLVQVRERRLMDLDESDIPRLFDRAGFGFGTSWEILSQYQWPSMAGESPPSISLEKRWPALHHLLTGEFGPAASPLSRAILGGRPIGTDLGAGAHVRYLWADEVREVSDALSSLTCDDLRQRYAPAALRASGHIFDDEDDEEGFAVLEGYFQLLATYYRIATLRANAMLIRIN